MIKHVAPNNVLSYFNPIVSLKSTIKGKVNDDFLTTIAREFFFDKVDIDQVQPLDMDKIKTEIDFDKEMNFVKTYLYKEIIETIEKDANGKVKFIPKYVFTFDRDLTPYNSDQIYPYHKVIENFKGQPEKIAYGCMRLGQAPVLFYIWIDIQMLIKFIKQLHTDVNWEKLNYHDKPSEKQQITANQIALSEIQDEKSSTTDSERLEILKEQEEILKMRALKPEMPLMGKAGRLRINLQWDTIDDLDLHVIDPDKNEICYRKKSAICQGRRGELDVDANAGAPFTSHPQENIVWEFPPKGKYEVRVNLYAKRDIIERIPFEVKILPDKNQGRVYSGIVSLTEKTITVATFDFSNEIGLENVIKLY